MLPEISRGTILLSFGLTKGVSLRQCMPADSISGRFSLLDGSEAHRMRHRKHRPDESTEPPSFCIGQSFLSNGTLGGRMHALRFLSIVATITRARVNVACLRVLSGRFARFLAALRRRMVEEVLTSGTASDRDSETFPEATGGRSAGGNVNQAPQRRQQRP